MVKLESVHVPHLGGIDASYHMPRPYDKSKPTLILVNSLTTSAELFRPQYEDETLNNAANLLCIEPLGHGQTRTKRETWTFWDNAIMNLQVMDKLGIDRAFALGTSQGGFIVVRMALLAPEKIEGVLPLGTAMDYESQRSRDLGCWDGASLAKSFVGAWGATAGQPDFYVGDDYAGAVVVLGFGEQCPADLKQFWIGELKKNYQGDDGRHRISMSVLNVGERDGLLGKLPYVHCPVLWLHGTSDKVFSVANAEEEIKMFTAASSAELKVIENGHHFLSGSHPKEVNQAAIEFIKKFHK